MSKYPDRIPYDAWINSQLSIARHYGRIKLDGAEYVLDYDNCRHEGDKYFPDLVKESAMPKPVKAAKRPRRVKPLQKAASTAAASLFEPPHAHEASRRTESA